MATDLTDYTEAFRCDELAASTALTGVNGNTIAVVGASPPAVATDGHVDDPAGTTRCRGFMRPVGDASPSYFKRAFSASDDFDIRGLTSCTIAMWVKLRSTSNEGPIVFSIHNPLAANGQAFIFVQRHLTVGSNPAPAFFMLDGIIPFNAKFVQATDAVSPVLNSWEFLAGGYDAARNKIFQFWGRAVGESYYAEADGFAAGFGYTGAAGCEVGVGQYKSGAGSIGEHKSDHILWYKGRALTQADLTFLWHNHAGRALDDLIAGDDDGAAAYRYYHGRV